MPIPTSAPDLDAIFASLDQSALMHNYVVSVDPAPNAWSREASPQSPIGRVAFPEVVEIVRGDVLTHGAGGAHTVHRLAQREWRPWQFVASSAALRVERAITRDAFLAQVDLLGDFADAEGLLLLELAGPTALGTTLTNTADRVRIAWSAGGFDAELHVSNGDLVLAGDASPITEWFAGVEGGLNPAQAAWTLRHLGRAWLGVRFRGSVALSFRVLRHGAVSPPPLQAADMVAAERQRWARFFADEAAAPATVLADPVLRDTWYFAWQSLWANRCEGGAGCLPHPFISPARLHYGSQWLWDEVFHSAVVAHLQRSSELAYTHLANFFRAQTPDGQLHGTLKFTDPNAHEKAESVGLATQPPVLGLLMQRLQECPGWPASPHAIAALYEHLLAYARWWASPARDPLGHGLASYYNSFETGVDQSTRWDGRLLNAGSIVGPIRPTEAVDLNIWLSLLWEVLADMARRLGRDTEAAAHDTDAAAIIAAIESRMWHETDGFYYDLDTETGEQTGVRSSQGFIPLLSTRLRPERLARLIDAHLLDPASFWTPWPVPSIPANDPRFTRDGMWRGPTWINLNWMIVEGLHRQGRAALATDLARRTIELVGPRYAADGTRTRSPRIWEWYDPIEGHALGNNQYGWSSLVIDLIARFAAPQSP